MSTPSAPDLPLVSIIIPVFNGANYLASAIESALAQSYPHIEIIVVNDGSTDDKATAVVAKSYGSKIRYFEKRNGGCGSALNYGIERMNGEYFSWLSHDDLYDSGKIDLQVRHARARAADPDFAAVCCAYRVWHVESDIKEPQQIFSAAEFNRCKFYGLFRGAVNGNAMLIRKRVFDDIGLFDPSLRTTQDYDFFFRMMKRYSIFYHDDILVTARIHRQQDTIAKNELNMLESDRLWSHFIDDSESCGIERYESSSLLYWLKFANHLALSPYPFTREKIFRKLATALELHEFRRTPKVSVVLPFAEVDGAFLTSAKTAFMQTHPDIEFIFAANRLISDGGLERLHRLARVFGRDFRLVRAEEKDSLSYACNRGLDAATGELVAFIEAGDIWHPSKIARQAAFLDADASIELCSTGWRERRLEPSQFLSFDRIYRNREEFTNVAHPMFRVSTMMIRASNYRFDEALAAGEEIMFFGAHMSTGRFGHLPFRMAAIQPRNPLPFDFAHALESRSRVWKTFSETSDVDHELLESCRFSYIKAAASRGRRRDLEFLFNQRHHITRRVVERHGFWNLTRYGLRKIAERTKRRVRRLGR